MPELSALQPVANRSSTITLGGAAQTLMAANLGRHGWFIQNQSTGDLWVRVAGTAAAVEPSIWLPAGAVWEMANGYAPTDALSIFGATTGQAFAALEW